MREKYTPFLATNLTTLLTLFKQLSMKNVVAFVGGAVLSFKFHENRSHGF